MASSSTVSSLLFLLILMFSFYLDVALGAQTEIRKLKEMMKMRRNLEGNNERSSKMYVPRSRSLHCQGFMTSFKNLKTTYHYHGKLSPKTGVRDSFSFFSDCFPFTCIPCNPFSGASCYTVHCVRSTHCQQYPGYPMTCSTTENCSPTSGD